MRKIISAVGRIARPAHLRRFLAVARRDGSMSALRKAAHYARLLLRNEAVSAVAAGELPGPLHGQRYHMLGYWVTAADGQAFHVTSPPVLGQRMRRLAIVGDLNIPQCRKYRVEQMHELARPDEFEVEHAFYLDHARAAAIMQRATHVILYRLHSNEAATALLYEARRLKVRLIYDIDDPVFSIPALRDYRNLAAVSDGLVQQFLADAPRYLDVMNACDGVSLSTPNLCRHASLFTTRPVMLRRNFADRETLEAGAAAMRVAGDGGRRGFTVAFSSGSFGHEEDFLAIRDEVAAFLDAGEDRRLVVAGRFREELLPQDLRRQVTLLPFTDYPSYLGMLAQADCAIVPLLSDSFNDCKSAVRVLDAQAVGLPVVANDVGDLGSMISCGETGLLAGRPGSWRDALETLAGDRAGAAAMGRAARRSLECEFSARRSMPVMDENFAHWLET